MAIGLGVVALATGILIGWLFARSRSGPRLAQLETELKHHRNSAADFETLSGKTLDKAVAAAADRIGTLVKPIETSLDKVNKEVTELEKARSRDYGALTRGLTSLEQTTGSLATALRSPTVRGQWGELQLRNVVEAAGMLNYCDFREQTSVATERGVLRPDMIVRLPNGRQVVVDAKAVFQSLLDAEASTDQAERDRHLDDYVRQIREKVTALSRKSYWEQFSPTPDFVIMFIPGEGFYRTAIERDPSLIEVSPSQRVIIASPTTLITVLRSIALGWREAEVAENARVIEQLGRELYSRLATMTSHFAELGKSLDKAAQSYNKTVSSLERRVLVQARRFADHGVGADKPLPEPVPVETSAQLPQTIELAARTADAA